MSTPSKPLTATEALRRIAAEEIARRQAQGLSHDNFDLAGGVPVLNALDEPHQNRPQVLV